MIPFIPNPIPSHGASSVSDVFFVGVQVYVATSGRAGGGQGLFARREFLPGELISYFAGKKTVEEEFLFDNMTAAEEEDAASYYFNLAENSPGWWGVPEGQVGQVLKWNKRSEQVVDVPSVMRSTSQFRTTLGHKTNSAFFDERNAEFDTVRHNNENCQHIEVDPKLNC